MPKIFLIDDNKAYCEQIQKSLELKNFHIEFETDAWKGLDRALKQDWDVILVDMILAQQLDGLAILKEIKKHNDEVPVIMISGSSVLEPLDLLIGAGAFDCMEKPIELDRLVLTLKNALHLRKLAKLNKRLINDLEQSMSRVGLGDTIKKALSLLTSIPDKPERLLILGEKGTGKELIARFLHFTSARKYGPFVTHYCQNQKVKENEIYDFCRQIFQQAHQGTLFLKEIHQLDLKVQQHLSQLLHQNFFYFHNNTHAPYIDIRIIASSSANLNELMERNLFLPQLFNLLSNFTIKVPALRERPQDIPQLLQHFVQMESQASGAFINQIAPEVFDLVKQENWPGNTGQLKQVAKLMVTLNRNGVIDIDIAKLALNYDQLLNALKTPGNEQDVEHLINEMLKIKRR